VKPLAFAVAVCAIASSAAAAADRAKSPADATVFIRMVGNVHVEVEEFGVRRTTDRERVEIGTGSGFVISPYGYVLTNAHVISDGDLVVRRGPSTAKITVKVSRIDVCFPADGGNPRGSCAEASVYASDAAVDLAVLFVSAPNLPYLALGDSDAVAAGQPVTALGYPFGREVEVGQAISTPDLVPSVSTTPGAVSAFRNGPSGERQYLQISSSVNPGNSGGPVVDRDGFVVGVVRMKLADAADIAFAIPINRVKDFLEGRGLDQLMPVRRLRLGPFQTIEGKGVGLRLPEGMTDRSPFRAHVETDPGATPSFKIDRVASPWNAKQVEQVLLDSQSFERFSAAGSESQMSARRGDARLLIGHAAGTAVNSDDEIRMDYAILDLGGEKLVARYIGPAQQIAFNASVLRESLNGLDGQKLLGGDLDPIERLQWSGADDRSVPVPAGWLVEPGAPAPCAQLPAATTAVAASPPRDFTIVVRAAVWSAADFSPEDAAARCSPNPSRGSGSYSSRPEWLGITYSVDGVFVHTATRGIIQLEVVAPAQKSAFTRALLAAWIAIVSER
jgi:S1-C subfamily serine protease